MRTGMAFALTSLLFFVFLSACGPSQAEIDATATQVVTNKFATQTAQAPTSTTTFTPSPTPTATPTATSTQTPTPKPTNTPTITPTPTPPFMAAMLTLDDLPGGFEVVPAEQLRDSEKDLPDGSSVYGFQNDKSGQTVLVFLIPYSEKAKQKMFDSILPQTVEVIATSVGADPKTKELKGLEDIGEVRLGITSVVKEGSISKRWDIVGFRRGEVGVYILSAYYDGDKPAVPIGDLARLQDERIKEFLASNPEIHPEASDNLNGERFGSQKMGALLEWLR